MTRKIPVWVAASYFLLSMAAVAAAADMPGGEMGELEVVTATVDKVDLSTREVTLKGVDGRLETVRVGPEARNLGQVKAGDVVAELEPDDARLDAARTAAGIAVGSPPPRPTKTCRNSPSATTVASRTTSIAVVIDVVPIAATDARSSNSSSKRSESRYLIPAAATTRSTSLAAVASS